jgi:microfibrillar-associated protein 1
MEVMEVGDEGHSGEESESEEYPDSEDEMEPRHKPVFIGKKDQVTLQERKAEALRPNKKHNAWLRSGASSHSRL